MTYIRLRMNWMNRVALAGLLIAFVLTTLAPDNAAAQAATLNLGTHSGINLNLILPVTTADGKVYYHLDQNNSENSNSDNVPRNALHNLFNGGADTIDTQDGNHDGSDDERSFISGSYTLVLPTLAEMQTLRTDQGNQRPSGWVDNFYHTATPDMSGHSTYRFFNGTTGNRRGDEASPAAFQLIFMSQLSFPAIDEQIYFSLQSVSVTLPAAIDAGNAVGPLTYTLTPSTNIPDGMSFDPATRILSGIPTTDGVFTLTYTVTDAIGDTASQDFTVTVITPGVRPAALNLGTHSGINLNLIRPVTTADGKVYYYLDDNDNGIAELSDDLSHNVLDNLLNGGADTIDTQDGDHDGSDDERSFVIGPYTLVLPTEAELQTLRADPGNQPPPGWVAGFYHTATFLMSLNRHRVFSLLTGQGGMVGGIDGFVVSFQVIFDSQLSFPDIDDQIYFVPQVISFTLPAAIDAGNAVSPLTYTLTSSTNIPDGLSFDPATRILSGIPTTDGVFTLTYTVTDAIGDTASQDFTVTVFTPGVRHDVLNFGTVSGVDLNLIFPVTTADGKVYYYLDASNNGMSTGFDDIIAHSEGSNPSLSTLLNGGEDVIDTQASGHDGSDDERSAHVFIGTLLYVLILPTLAELEALYADQLNSAPPNWNTGLDYHSATLTTERRHRSYNLGTGVVGTDTTDTQRRFVAFQAITVPAAPTGVTVTLRNESLIVHWTPVSAVNDGGDAITGYTALVNENVRGARISASCTATGINANTCPLSDLTNDVEYRVVVRATNTLGNSISSVPVFATPRPVPSVTITDDAAAATANIADGDITFTFGWNEEVTDFAADDINVTGVNNIGQLLTTVAGTTYTLVVRPNANTNDGIITITVAANAVTSSSNLANIMHRYTLNYDTGVPDNPTFTTPVAEDNIINSAERSTGVALSGSLTAETSATAVLCFSGGSGEACPDGTLRDATVNGAVWSYTLTTDDINAMGQGDEILTVTVMDAAGNPSADVSHTINVDTFFPISPSVCFFGSDGCSAGDNNINVDDLTDGVVTLTGTREDVATDRLIICINDGGNTADINCSGGDSYDPVINGGDWSLTLNEEQITPYGQGDFIVNAIAIDMAGNPIISLDRTLRVDTIPPPAPTINVVAGDDIINAAERDSGSVRITGSGRVVAGLTVLLLAGGDANCGSGTQLGIRDGESDWSFSLQDEHYTIMGEGSEMLCVTTTDGVRNISNPATRRITIDTILPVFPGDATTATERMTISVATGTSAGTTIYDAMVTDNDGVTEVADTGLTYTLGGTGATPFSLSATGALSPTADLATTATYNIEITATDEAGNAATQYLTIVVSDVPTVAITNDAAGAIANIADGDLTFTFTFSEEVMGFVTGDITVTGGNAGAFSGDDPGTLYTLVVTPTPNNAGTITVTVAAGAATATVGTDRTNLGASEMQAYDTQAPTMPSIDEPITGEDNFINAAEATAGVSLTGGGVEMGGSVTLCLPGGRGTSCGTDRTLRVANVTGTGWAYTLTAADITAMGQGDERLTVIANDAAGNPSTVTTRDITIDTVAPNAPTITTPIAGDDFINAAEQTSGFTVAVTSSSDTTGVVLCLGETLPADTDCGGTLHIATGGPTTWSYTLTANNLSGLAEGVLTLTAIASDAVGNMAVSAARTVTVDTVAPTAPTIDVVAGDDIINAAERTPGPVEITGSGREAEAIVILRFAGDDATCSSGTTISAIGSRQTSWSAELTNEHYNAMGEGPEILCVTARDAASNVSNPSTRNITVDTLLPVFPGDATTATERMTISAATSTSAGTTIYDAMATDNGGVTEVADTGLTYTLGGTGATPFSLSVTGALSPTADLATTATYNIEITATDEAGNAATQYLTIDVVEDTALFFRLKVFLEGAQ